MAINYEYYTGYTTSAQFRAPKTTTYKVYVWGACGSGGSGSGSSYGLTFATGGGGGGGGGAGGFAASQLELQAGQEIPITIDASQTKFGSYLYATSGGNGSSSYYQNSGGYGGGGGKGFNGNIINLDGAAGGAGGKGSHSGPYYGYDGEVGGNGGAQPGTANNASGVGHRAGGGGGGARLPGSSYCKYVADHMNDFRGGKGGYDTGSGSANLAGGVGSSMPPIALSPNVKLYGAGCGGGGGCSNKQYGTYPAAGGTGHGGVIIIEMADNQPPTTPGTVLYTGNMRAGNEITVSCGPSTDPDGDIIQYIWQSRVDSDTFVKFDTTLSPSTTITVPTAGTTFQVRVRAQDARNNNSAFSTGAKQTILHNAAPSVPGEIAYVGQIAAGKLIQLTCGAATDPDGDPFTYEWERSVDGGAFAHFASTVEPRTNDTVPTTGETYQVRVKAVDSDGATSGYQTGARQSIFHNRPPQISGQDENLGLQNTPVRYGYTVVDEDPGQTLRVTEKILSDDRVVFQRTLTPQSGEPQAIDTSPLWIELNDVELVIEAEDGEGGYAKRSVRFGRKVDSIAACRSFVTNAPVYKCLVMLVATRPAGALLTLQVCNNPFDAVPVWEDISERADKVHAFRNQDVENPGLAYRFTLSKGSGVTQVERVTIKYA